MDFDARVESKLCQLLGLVSLSKPIFSSVKLGMETTPALQIVLKNVKHLAHN